MALRPTANPDNDSIDEDIPLDQFITYRLLTLTNRLNRQAMQILETEASLRLPEWRCLAFVWRCSRETGKASLNEIAEITGMDRALISRAVQGLVEKGHVLTERDTKDRRVVHAVMTRQGEALFHHTLPLMQRRQMHLLGALSAQDRKAVYRIIDRLSNAVEEWEEKEGQGDHHEAI